MAVDYFTGFETGDASQVVSLGTNATIQTTTKRTGAYALKQAFGGTASVLKTGINRASGSYRYGYLLDVTTDASHAADTISARTAGNVSLWTVTANSDGAGAYTLKLAYFVGGGGAFTQVGSTFAISADTWYALEVRWVISATVGELELFVDGVSRASGTGLNLGSANFDIIRSNPWLTNGNVDQYYDDVCAADARTGVGKSGLYKVKSGSPTYDAWTKQGGGAIVAEWVDVPFSATNNARSTAASQAQTGLIEDPAAASVAIASGDTINAATLGAIIKRLTTSPSPTTQTRNPTSEVSVTGTWSGTNRHLLLDDYPDSGNPITDGTTCSAAGVAVFGFSGFSVPAGATSISVQVLYYDFKNGSQASAIGAAIRCNDTTNRLSATHNPGNGNAAIAARSDNYATNPKSAAAWTVDDVNGVGTNGLTAFGLSVTDASPTVTVSCVQLQVTYTPAATDGTYKIRRRINGSDTDTAKTLTTTDAWYDDGIWTATLAHLGGGEMGAFRDSGGDHNVQVEDIYLLVDFTPPSATTVDATKAAAYRVLVTQSTTTKAAAYRVVVVDQAVTKAAAYRVATALETLTKAAAYRVQATLSALAKDAAYRVLTTVSPTKAAAYRVLLANVSTLTTAAAYRVLTVLSPGKTAAYRVLTANVSTLTKAAEYAIASGATTVDLTKAAAYRVVAPVATLTKAAAYRVLSAGVSTLTAASAYRIVGAVATLTKAAAYRVQTAADLTKSAAYAIAGAAFVDLTKASAYRVQATASLALAAAYRVLVGTVALTKSAAYAIGVATDRTKAAQYAVQSTRVLTLTSRYVLSTETTPHPPGGWSSRTRTSLPPRPVGTPPSFLQFGAAPARSAASAPTRRSPGGPPGRR